MADERKDGGPDASEVKTSAERLLDRGRSLGWSECFLAIVADVSKATDIPPEHRLAFICRLEAIHVARQKGGDVS